MKSPFAAGLGPGGPRTLYLLGVISAIKALGLLGIAEALALGFSSLFDGADGWQGAVVLGAVSVLARAGASWLTQWFATRASLGAKESLRAQLADRLTESSELGVGEATALATRGLDDLDPYYRTVLPAAVGAAVIPLAVGARILFADPLSALIVAFTVPLIPVFMILIGQHTRDRVDAAAGSLALLSDHLVELARGLPVLVGLGRLDEQSAALSRISEQYRTRTTATLRTAFLSALALELIATISVALVAVTVGIRLIGGDLTLQVGLLVLILAPECYTPLREIGVAFHASQDGVAALDRVRAALRTSDRKAARQRSESSSAALDVRGLTVTYDGRDAAAVDGLSFTVAMGETVALTGPSGAGKSTVLRAIAERLVPAGGDIAGSEQIAWLPQHPRTVADTVREELALYGPAGAPVDELLDELGLGASGASDPAELSPGELRRLAFARALLRVEAGADLLLLDEPTAHLDAASARIIERKIAALRGGPAVLLVSHDPRVTALADRLVAVGVDGGVALGTADDAAEGDPAVASVPTRSTSSRADDSGNPAGGSAESLRLLASLLRPVRWRLAAAVALGVLAALSAAALTAVSGWLIVRAAQEPAIMYLLVAIVGVRFFGIARSALRYAERLVTHDTVFASVATLRGRLWSAIARRGTASPALRRTGTALDLLVITADQVRDLTPRVLLPPLVGAATVAAALITVGLLHPAALPAYAVGTGVALVLAPLIALLGDRHSSAGEAAIRSTVARRIGSLLGASDDLRGNGVDGPVRAALRALDERASRDARRSSWARGLGSAVVVAALGGTAIGMVALCTPAVAAGTLGVEVVAVLALLPLGLIDPLLAVVEAVQQWPALTAALGRLAPVLGASEEERVTDDRFGEEVRRADSLELDDVSARWAPDVEPVFVGASARVERGQWLAVTGPSGSGKTTMLSVLLRYLEPASGRYLVDGTDARALDSDSVRSRLAWTPQEAHLFSSTIRGNLLLARQLHDRPTDAELRSVLEHVGLGPLVEGMADGLDTMVGAGGAALSGGEAQRLAVARALLSRSDVVLLDEPTAHLDAETASHMMADLRGALADRAVVLVTHRADDLEASDLKVTLGDRVPPRRATVPVQAAR